VFRRTYCLHLQGGMSELRKGWLYKIVCVWKNESQRTGVIVRTRSGEEQTGARCTNEKAVIAGGEKVRITRNCLTGPWQRHNSRRVLHTGVEHHIVYIALFLSCCHTVLMHSFRGMCISCCWSEFLVMKFSFTLDHMTADQQAA